MQFRCSLSLSWRAIAVATLIALIQGPALRGQSRINDKDLETMMSNLRENAKNFHSTFDSAVEKSAIRKTSQEKDAKNLVDDFAKQTDSLLKDFKKTHKADADVPSLVDKAARIDRLVYQLNLGTRTTVAWESTRSALHQIAAAYGVPEPYLQSPAAVSDAPTGSCLSSVGKQEAQRLVDRCNRVSPATHSPCNIQNSCVEITDEIRRGCQIIGANAPGFCNNYR